MLFNIINYRVLGGFRRMVIYLGKRFAIIVKPYNVALTRGWHRRGAILAECFNGYQQSYARAY